MNQYLNYYIAQDRHAEFLQQAKENRRFDRQLQTNVVWTFSLPVRLLESFMRHRRAVFNTVRQLHKAKPNNLRPGMSG